MNQKTKIFGVSLFIVAGAIITISGCRKEKPEELLNEASKAAPLNGGNKTLGTLVAQKAYNAATDFNGLCTGGPIVHYNSQITYFNPATGASQTTVNDQTCYISGNAWNSTNCKIYVTTGSAAQGASSLYTVLSTGALSATSSIIEKSAGVPLYVEEMEFDNAGDLYLISKNATTWGLYKIPAANLSNPTITANFIGIIVGTALFNGKVGLAYDYTTNTMKLIYEAPGYGTQTRVATISRTTAAISGVQTYFGLNAMTTDFATYYNGSTLYFAKSGTLRTLIGGVATTVGSVTMNVTNDMTYYGNCAP